MEREIVYMVAVFVATATLSAYIFYQPNPKKRKPKGSTRSLQVHGLANYGNQCFVNVILQAFASCLSVQRWLAKCLEHKRMLLEEFNRTQLELEPRDTLGRASRSGKSGRSAFSLLFGRRRTNRSVKFDGSGLNQCSLVMCSASVCRGKLSKLLHKILIALNGQDRNSDFTLSATYVLRALQTPNFCLNNEEQDAHELFNVLTSTLEAENSHLVPLYTIGESIKQLQEECVGKPLIDGRLHFSLPTKGLIANILVCCTCAHKFTITLDEFQSISLAIPDKPALIKKLITLEQCLRYFVCAELLQSVNCEHCAKASTNNGSQSDRFPAKEELNSKFSKRLMFARLPQVLSLHIQRLAWLPDGRLIKKTQLIDFPQKLLMDEFVYRPHQPSAKENATDLRLPGGNHQFDLQAQAKNIIKNSSNLAGSRMTNRSSAVIAGLPSPTDTVLSDSTLRISGDSNSLESNTANHLSIDSGKNWYHLCAVVVHLGSAFNGHYVCYRKLTVNLKVQWYYVSDSIVCPCNFEEVLKAPAYMLFYERTLHKA